MDDSEPRTLPLLVDELRGLIDLTRRILEGTSGTDGDNLGETLRTMEAAFRNSGGQQRGPARGEHVPPGRRPIDSGVVNITMAADAWARMALALERAVDDLGPEMRGVTTIDAPLAAGLARLFDLEGSTDPCAGDRAVADLARLRNRNVAIPPGIEQLGPLRQSPTSVFTEPGVHYVIRTSRGSKPEQIRAAIEESNHLVVWVIPPDGRDEIYTFFWHETMRWVRDRNAWMEAHLGRDSDDYTDWDDWHRVDRSLLEQKLRRRNVAVAPLPGDPDFVGGEPDEPKLRTANTYGQPSSAHARILFENRAILETGPPAHWWLKTWRRLSRR